MTTIDVPSGTVLTEQGAAGSEFFVIVEGSASVWRNGGRLSLLEPGTFFGELALLDREYPDGDSHRRDAYAPFCAFTG